jgi:hypothetical protein
MENKPSCRALMVSWLLAILMVAVISIYGRIGLFPGVILLLVAERIRGDHDDLFLQQIFQHQKWRIFIAGYYLLFLGPIVIYSVLEHIYLSDLPIALFVLMGGFPIIIAVLLNDVTTCLRNKSK